MRPGQFVRIALITTPVMAAILVTPAFIISNLPVSYFPIGIGAGCVAISVCWFLNGMLYFRFPKSRTQPWLRFGIGSGVMLFIAWIVSRFVQPPIPISGFQFDLMRAVNVLAVNGMILILTELLLVREMRKTAEKEIASLKLVNLETQYKLLLEKTNPHFLFNALGTAKSLVKTNPDKAETYLVNLSGFLRSTFEQQRDLVPLKDELQLAVQYIDLQRIRFGAALQFTVERSEDDTNYHLPYFTLMTLVENAVKHNAMSPEEPLNISISRDQDQLVVRNNLRRKFVLQPTTRTGLTNLSERYRLLTGEVPQIIETEERFEVRVQLLKA